MFKKTLYTTPSVDVLELHTEGVVCQSGVLNGIIIGGFTDDGDTPISFDDIIS